MPRAERTVPGYGTVVAVAEQMPAPLFDREFAATAIATRQVLQELRARLTDTGVDAGLQSRVEMVLAEVFNNITEHAYAARDDGIVRLRAVMSDGLFRVHVRDAGGPMPGDAPPEGRLPGMDGPCDTLPEGGFGWFLIRSQTGSLSYKRENGENHLELQFPHDAGP